jgi:hypothetical protein
MFSLLLTGPKAKINYFFMRRRMKAMPPRQTSEVRAGSGTGGTSLVETPSV